MTKWCKNGVVHHEIGVWNGVLLGGMAYKEMGVKDINFLLKIPNSYRVQ